MNHSSTMRHVRAYSYFNGDKNNIQKNLSGSCRLSLTGLMEIYPVSLEILPNYDFLKKIQQLGSFDSQNIFSCKSYRFSESELDKEQYLKLIFTLFLYCTNNLGTTKLHSANIPIYS